MELDLQHIKPSPDQIVLEAKKQQKQEYKLIGSMLLKPGLILWELNIKELILKKAEIQINKAVNFETKSKTENHKVQYNPACIYFQTHCKRTAIKKANKLIYKITGISNLISE